MSAGCRFCGHVPPGSRARRRGSLYLAGDPPEVFAKGEKLSLSPMRAAILTLLVRRGSATHEELLSLRPTMTHDTLRVTIFHLRTLIPADMEILNDFAKGYVLAERELVSDQTTELHPHTC